MFFKIIFFNVSVFLFLFFQNGKLLSSPCLFSVGVVGIFVTLIYLLALKIFSSKEKARFFIYCFGLLFWGICPLCRPLIFFLSRNAFLLELTKKGAIFVVFFLATLIFLAIKKLSVITCEKINKFFDTFSISLALIFCLNALTKSTTKEKNFTYCLQNRKVYLQEHPNVYHILLDAHSSNYVLKKYYDFNNTEFYEELRSKGFTAIESSFSHYPATQMSVASMLNLEYLPEAYVSPANLEYLRVNNKVFSTFYKNNFDIHVFSETLVMSYGPKFKKVSISNFALYWLWIRHTPIKWFLQKMVSKYMCLDHINNIEIDLEQLASAKDKFGSHNNLFYAHLVCPHAPFCYGENNTLNLDKGLIGMFTDSRGYLANDNETLSLLKQKYLSTLQMIDRKILTLINTILSQYKMDEQPIIILHSDHGMCLTTISPLTFDSNRVSSMQLNEAQEQLYGNLFAIFCPKNWAPEEVPLSLVNLYRFIFNNLFNERYEYLENFCCIKK